MQANLERYKQDLSKLISLGNEMHLEFANRVGEGPGTFDFERKYQQWYTEACAVIRQLLPQRLGEFESLYKVDPKRRNLDALSFTIQDWLMGARVAVNVRTGEKPFDDFAAVVMRFGIQCAILRSVETRFESSLYDIRQLVQADLFDSELEASRELLKKGFLRAAGVVVGVVLEKHLSQVCDKHGIPVKKKHPTINDLNELLKNNNVIEVETWRFIKRLGDLRNLCAHNKEREPTKVEVEDLIDGADKAVKTLF